MALEYVLAMVDYGSKVCFSMAKTYFRAIVNQALEP
jgi:hypothetical protein